MSDSKCHQAVLIEFSFDNFLPKKKFYFKTFLNLRNKWIFKSSLPMITCLMLAEILKNLKINLIIICTKILQ